MPSESSSPLSRPVLLFGLLCLLCGIGCAAYAFRAWGRLQSVPANAAVAGSLDNEAFAAIERQPYVLFRNTAMGPDYGNLSVVRLDDLEGVRYSTGLSCERVYATPGIGLCLQADRGVFSTYQAVAFDAKFQVRHSLNLPGTPSRTRVSPDGRWGATTVFVKGDSYNSGGFSTRTSIIDLQAGKVIGDLESFKVTKDGQPFQKVDFNFWGVTFAPTGDRFFATLGTSGYLYLVEGNIADRAMRVLRDGVECPSLSPDGERLVFKSRTTQAGRLIWNLRVLDLATGAETLVREERSVDDQAEWLDAEHVLYGMPRASVGSASSDIWVARADGTGEPGLFLKDACSPCVVRAP